MAALLTLFAFGLFLGYYFPYLYTLVVLEYKNAKLLFDITPKEVNESILCQGPHEWLEVNIQENGQQSRVTVCKDCGFIPSSNLMATKEGLNRVLENDRLTKLDIQCEKEFLDMETQHIKNDFSEELKNGLDFSKLNKTYVYGQTSYKRYILFKLAKLENKHE